MSLKVGIIHSVFPYTLPSIPNIANSNGERPTLDVITVAVKSLVDGDICSAIPVLAPMIRRRESIARKIQPPCRLNPCLEATKIAIGNAKT